MKFPPARGVRTGAVLAVASAAVLAVGGCQSGGGKNDSAGSQASSPAASPARTKLLKGSTLKTLLLPAAAMPKGFRIVPGDSRDTGDVVSAASSAPVPAKELCEDLDGLSWIRVTGVGYATFAQNDYGNAAKTEQIAQEIDAYHGDDARQAMAKLRKVFAHCATFVDRSSSPVARVRVRTAALHGVGDEAVKAVETSPTWEGGMTLAAIRVGDAIVTTFYSSSHADKGASAVTIAEKIAKKVQAAS